MKENDTDSFEKSLRRLEDIARLLDREDLGLDSAISLYEEGIELSRECFSRLKEAEVKITTLKKSLERKLEFEDGTKGTVEEAENDR